MLKNNYILNLFLCGNLIILSILFFVMFSDLNSVNATTPIHPLKYVRQVSIPNICKSEKNLLIIIQSNNQNLINKHNLFDAYVKKLIAISKKINSSEKKISDMIKHFDEIFIKDFEKNVSDKEIFKIADFKLYPSKNGENIPIKFILTKNLSPFLNNYEIIIKESNSSHKTLPFWIQYVSKEKVIMWILINKLINIKNNTISVFYTKQNLEYSPLLSGEKVFPFFLDSNSCHNLIRDENTKLASMNIGIYPNKNSFSIKTELDKRDTRVKVNFSPIKEDCVLEYQFINHLVPFASNQFQVSLALNDKKITNLDSPIYQRNEAAHRKHKEPYQEITFAKMEYNQIYSAKHIVKGSEKKVDYQIINETNNKVYQLHDQEFFGQNPAIDIDEGITELEFGSCCDDDVGHTEIKYFFIYPILSDKIKYKVIYSPIL
ncbi:MAG: hypothetical protein ACD_79C00262G0001 [uncultured bacterium]|nr:MAG: hypothetical protein ACD_79C00262G0001 [uncultured bacterium]